MWPAYGSAMAPEQQQPAWHYQNQHAPPAHQRAAGGVPYPPDPALARLDPCHGQPLQQPLHQQPLQALATTPSAVGQQQQALVLGGLPLSPQHCAPQVLGGQQQQSLVLSTQHQQQQQHQPLLQALPPGQVQQPDRRR
mmetsp:Transcript_20738/g.58177  ORF Transcript_20738/g.58177 Transcript_20738/m.58177 type:complete len:138 (+) Transcript_20738:152-565(+)